MMKQKLIMNPVLENHYKIGVIGMKSENRFCEFRQTYCKFANRCLYCQHNVGNGLCGKSYNEGKGKDYVKQHGNNKKCFTCDMIKFMNKEQAMEICNECLKIKFGLRV